jgi:hypothetical protein
MSRVTPRLIDNTMCWLCYLPCHLGKFSCLYCEDSRLYPYPSLPQTLDDYLWRSLSTKLAFWTSLYDTNPRNRPPTDSKVERRRILYVSTVLLHWHRLSIYRSRIKTEINMLQQTIHSSFIEGDPPSHEEFDLVVMVIIAAILNHCTSGLS